ncbi:hypothetical protein LINGRAHAP2_LOCUS7670 [Linum grandiflorum]
MSDVPPLVKGPQAPVAAVIGNTNDVGEGAAAAQAKNGQPQNGEAIPQPPNAPLAIDEEMQVLIVEVPRALVALFEIGRGRLFLLF